MSHAIAVDTLKYTKRLEDAKIPRAQAEAQAAALSEVFDSNLHELATKGDLRELKSDLKSDLREIEIRIMGKIRLEYQILSVIAVMVASITYKVLFIM